VLDHLGFGRLAVLLVLGLVVFGPERLPELAGQAGRAIRQIKRALSGMTAEIREAAGPELAGLDLASLHPRRLLADLTAEAPESVAGPTLVPPTVSAPLSAPGSISVDDSLTAHLALNEHLSPHAAGA
jgi:sec-independent protein translocase protein TatB